MPADQGCWLRFVIDGKGTGESYFVPAQRALVHIEVRASKVSNQTHSVHEAFSNQ
jgi:hypothetical protein